MLYRTSNIDDKQSAAPAETAGSLHGRCSSMRFSKSASCSVSLEAEETSPYSASVSFFESSKGEELSFAVTPVGECPVVLSINWSDWPRPLS